MLSLWKKHMTKRAPGVLVVVSDFCMVDFKFGIGELAKEKGEYQILNVTKYIGMVNESVIRFPQQQCG
jgi:hypothetical protein